MSQSKGEAAKVVNAFYLTEILLAQWSAVFSGGEM